MREEVFRDLEAREIDYISSLNAYLLEVDEGRETMMIERNRRRDSIAYAELTIMAMPLEEYSMIPSNSTNGTIL